MGPVEALKLALERELAAMQFYQKFATEHNAAKQTFVFLCSEEQKHKELIETKIAELTRDY